MKSIERELRELLDLPGLQVLTSRAPRERSAAYKEQQAARRRERYATDSAYREKQKAAALLRWKKHRRARCRRMGDSTAQLVDFLRSVLYLARRDEFVLALEPFNPRIQDEGTHVISVRCTEDDGRHLVGLIELTEFAVRVTYARQTHRGLMDHLVARLRERFR